MDKKEMLLRELKMERPEFPLPKKSLNLSFVLIGALLSLPVLAYISYQKHDLEPEAPLDAALAVVEQARAPREASMAEVLLEASGFVVASRVATVSAKNFGLITEIPVEEGNFVSRGEVIARLDDRAARIDLELMQSQAESLRLAIISIGLELDQAQGDLAREVALSDKGFSSEAVRSKLATRARTLTNELAIAQSQYQTSLVQIRKQENLLEDFVIRAPFSGIVTEKNAQPGEIISPSTAGGGFTRTGLCTIVDMDSLEIVVDVNESFIQRIQKNQRVTGELYAYPGWEFSGVVVRIIPTADRAKATIRVRIKIAETDVRILPEMGVKVRFQSPAV
jgi:HlyD family secretion protein